MKNKFRIKEEEIKKLINLKKLDGMIDENYYRYLEMGYSVNDLVTDELEMFLECNEVELSEEDFENVRKYVVEEWNNYNPYLY